MVHQLDCSYFIFISCVGYSKNIVVNIFFFSQSFKKELAGPFNESVPRLNNTKLRCAIGPWNRLHLMKTQTADGILSQLCLPTCCSPQGHPGSVDSWLCGPCRHKDSRAHPVYPLAWAGPAWMATHLFLSISTRHGETPGKKAGRGTCDLLPSSQPCQDPKAQGT